MTYCPGGLGEYGTRCRDLQTDPDNCGACKDQCTDDQYCMGGNCYCRIGLIECNGQCVDPLSDVNNCSDCDIVCEGATPYCLAGTCSADDCDTEQLYSCDVYSCVDFDTDPLNCGDCGVTCGGNEVCVAGACQGYLPAEAGCTACPCDFCSDRNRTCCTFPGSDPEQLICVDATACP
jgi:hypothetical protein